MVNNIFCLSKTKQIEAKRSKTKQNKTKQNEAKQSKTKQSKTKQNEAKQSKTKQNKAKQNKSKQKIKKLKKSPNALPPDPQWSPAAVGSVRPLPLPPSL